MAESYKYLYSLQILRGISFLLIFLCHSIKIPYGGGIGVEFFFLISGFVLTLSSWEKVTSNSLIYHFKFLLIKIKKLYKLHIITTILVGLMGIVKCIIQKDFDLKIPLKLVFNSLLIQAWIPSLHWSNSLNGVAWYLSVMAFIYFIFPSILTNLKKIYKKLNILIVFSILGFIFQYIFSYLLLLFDINLIDETFYQWATYVFPVYRLVDFFFGSVICLFYLHHYKHLINISSSNATLLEIVTILIFILVCQKYPTHSLYTKAFFNWTIPYIFPCILGFICFIINKGFFVRLFCKLKILKIMGNLSSSAFLIHYLVILYLNTIMKLLKFDYYIKSNVLKATIPFIITLLLCSIYNRVIIKK